MPGYTTRPNQKSLSVYKRMHGILAQPVLGLLCKLFQFCHLLGRSFFRHPKLLGCLGCCLLGHADLFLSGFLLRPPQMLAFHIQGFVGPRAGRGSIHPAALRLLLPRSF